MSRQERRKKYKLTGLELKTIKDEQLKKGIDLAVETSKKVMHNEFGFGEKRLKRLEKAILKTLQEK